MRAHTPIASIALQSVRESIEMKRKREMCVAMCEAYSKLPTIIDARSSTWECYEWETLSFFVAIFILTIWIRLFFRFKFFFNLKLPPKGRNIEGKVKGEKNEKSIAKYWELNFSQEKDQTNPAKLYHYSHTDSFNNPSFLYLPLSTLLTFCAFMSAPASMRAFTFPACPLYAEWCSGVCPIEIS